MTSILGIWLVVNSTMLSEYITSLADVSFHIVAYMYARFRYSGKNPMRFAVFWRISVRFCGFRTPLTPPSTQFARQKCRTLALSWSVRERIRVITQKSSEPNYKSDSCTQFAREDVRLWPFYNSYVLRNHLDFTTSAIELYASRNVKVDILTFVNFQENYQTAEIYFYSHHVIPLNKCNKFTFSQNNI